MTRRELLERFSSDDGYFNTFGGNPVSCAAGLAVLDVIENEDLQRNALEVGKHLSDGLRALAEYYECIGDVRGSGLFIAVELVEDRDKRTPATALTSHLVNDLRDRGVLTNSIGADDNVLKLRSPLVLTRDDADYALGILDESLKSQTG